MADLSKFSPEAQERIKKRAEAIRAAREQQAGTITGPQPQDIQITRQAEGSTPGVAEVLAEAGPVMQQAPGSSPGVMEILAGGPEVPPPEPSYMDQLKMILADKEGIQSELMGALGMGLGAGAAQGIGKLGAAAMPLVKKGAVKALEKGAETAVPFGMGWLFSKFSGK